MAIRNWTGLAYDGNIDNPYNWTADEYGNLYGQTTGDTLRIGAHNGQTASGYLEQNIWGENKTPVRNFTINNTFKGNIGVFGTPLKLNMAQEYSNSTRQEIIKYVNDNYSGNFDEWMYNRSNFNLPDILNFVCKVNIELGNHDDLEYILNRQVSIFVNDYYGNRYHNYSDREIYSLNMLRIFGVYGNVGIAGDYAVIDTSGLVSRPEVTTPIFFYDGEVYNYIHKNANYEGRSRLYFRVAENIEANYPVSSYCDPYSIDPYCSDRILSLPGATSETTSAGYVMGYLLGTLKTKFLIDTSENNHTELFINGHFKELSLNGNCKVDLGTSTPGIFEGNYFQIDKLILNLNTSPTTTDVENSLTVKARFNINELILEKNNMKENILFLPYASNIEKLTIDGGSISLLDKETNAGVSINDIDFSPFIMQEIINGSKSIFDYIKFSSDSNLTTGVYEYVFVGQQRGEANRWSSYHAGQIALD